MPTETVDRFAKTPLTAQEKAERFVRRIVHDTHVKYQREMLKPDADAVNPDVNKHALISPEVKGVKRQISKSERESHVFQPHWFTHLRPNFWKAYFETLLYMQQK